MPPLHPDAPTAHRWLSDELGHSRYQEGRSLADLLQRWLDSLFQPGNPAAPPLGAVVALLLAAMLIVAVIFGIRRLRGGSRASRARAVSDSDLGPLDDPTSHRRAAARHRAEGNHDAAVIESFRALVADAGRRRAIVLIPGLTAQQAARQLTAAHPDVAEELRRAADCFDRARYADARPGGSLLTADDAAAVAELDERLAETRRNRRSTVTGAGA